MMIVQATTTTAILVITVIMVMGSAGVTALPCGATHTVAPDEGCWAVYDKAGTNEQMLELLNPDLKCSAGLVLGQKVCVAPCQEYYTVKTSDDTCFNVRTRYGIREAEFNAMNPGLDCGKMPLGQPLCLQSCVTYAKVGVDGSSCWDIFNKAGITEAQLKRLNPALDCDNLQEGQRLCSGACAKYTIAGGANGGNCWDIQDLNDVGGVDKLLAMNPGLDCDGLQAGQRVCVALSAPTSPLIWPPPKAPVVPPATTTTKMTSTTTTTVAKTTTTQPPSTTTKTTTRTKTTTSSTPKPTRSQLPTPCTKTHTIVNGDTCSDLAAANNIPDLKTFQAMNPQLNPACDLSLGQVVCIGNRITTCKNLITATEKDSCEDLAGSFGMSGPTDIINLNPGLDCKTSIDGLILCMGDKPASCFQFIISQPGDSCNKLKLTTDLTDSEWLELNGAKCSAAGNDALKPGTRLCARGPKTGCVQWEQMVASGSCAALSAKYKIPYEKFERMNSWVDCKKRIPPGTLVCTQNHLLTGCSKLHVVQDTETCDSIAAEENMTKTDLLAANPGLLCDVLKSGTSVCLEGPAQSCATTVMVMPRDTLTCADAAAKYSLTMEDFTYLNPALNCTTPIPGMTDLCIKAGGGGQQETQLLSSVLDSFNINDPEIVRLKNQFQANPTDANFGLLGARLLQYFSKTSDAKAKLAKLESSDPYFKSLVESKKEARKSYCALLDPVREAELSQCFCGNVEPLLYCVAQTQAHLQSYLSQPGMRQKIRRSMEDSLRKQFTPEFIKRAAFAEGYDLDALREESLRAHKRQESSPKSQNDGFSTWDQHSNNTVALSSREVGIGDVGCQIDGGLDKLFQGVKALQKGKKEALEWLNKGSNGNPLKDLCLGGKCCVPITGIPVPLEACVGAKICLFDYDFKNTIGGLNCVGKETCLNPASNSVFNPANSIIGDTSVVITIQLCLKIPDEIANVPVFGRWIVDNKCFLTVELKVFLFRGDLQIKLEVSALMLKLSLSVGVKMYPSLPQLCRDNYCKKRFCQMEIGKPTFTFQVKVNFWLTEQTVVNLDIIGLPSPCNEKQPTIDGPPNPFSGAVIGSYFPNWVSYHDATLLPRLLNQARQLTHIYVAFQTISYSIEYDRYYLDFADPWGDVNKCQGLTDAECHSYNGPEVNYESPGCMPIDVPMCAPGVVAVAPYLGYVSPSGGCPKPSGPTTCVNVGGVPNLRKIPCYTTLDGASRVPKYDGKPVVCGQFQFLLRQVKLVNPDIRIVLSIGGWYDSPYWSVATNSKYLDGFVDSIGRWTDVIEFDGVDIDWEFPGFEHGNQPVYPSTYAPGNVEETTDCSKSQCHYPDRLNDGERYANLLAALRARLGKSGPLRNGLTTNKVPFEITMAPPIGFDKIAQMHLREMCKNLDHINL
ncbi:hypothetical protein HDV05_007951 [Chytridiales sp. JEL 0842]|nr:hypothetical protein HDV05_007951 [Chytridiales sp. JEL 0842]